MLSFFKKNYVNILIALAYTIVASLVYGIWSYTAWHLWYVTLIIVMAIVVAAVIITYFWLKSENKNAQGIDKT